jgi:hypothetical protein
VASPDGRVTASLKVITCGREPPVATSFVLHKSGSNETVVVFQLAGPAECRIKWEGNSKVVVSVPAGSNINWLGTVAGYPEVYLATLQ